MSDEPPRNVKDLLVEMKDTSELMIDLAYTAVMYDSAEMAEEVLTLEEHMNTLQQQAHITLVLSGRSREDAERLMGVFSTVSAAEKIADAADDIATVVTGNIPIPPEFRSVLAESQETTAKIVVPPEIPWTSDTVGSFEAENGAGTRIIATRRDDKWLFDPGASTQIQSEDVLFIRGPQDSIRAVHRAVADRPFAPGTAEVEHESFRELADALIDMKDMMELSTGLAYGAVLFDNRELAEEVLSLESNADSMRDHVESAVLSAAGPQRDISELRGVYRIATASEVITDAAMEIASTVIDDIEPHPVLVEANRESDETILRTVIAADSDLVGRTLQETPLEADLGMTVIAIRHSDHWTYNPADDTTITAGDALIMRGPQEHREQVTRLSG